MSASLVLVCQQVCPPCSSALSFEAYAALIGKLFDLGFFRPCFLFGAVTLTASQLGLSFANSFATLFIAQGKSLPVLQEWARYLPNTNP